MNHQKIAHNIDPWQKVLSIVDQHHSSGKSYSNYFYTKLIITRWVSENLFIFLLQFAGLMLTTLSNQTSPLWFASGTSTAFIFLRGYSIFPGIFLGSLLAFVTQFNIEKSVCIAVLFALQPTLLFYFTLRFIGQTLIFYNKLLFFQFIFLSMFITFFFSTGFKLFGLTCLPNDHFVYASFSLWLANLNGLFLFSFAIISLDTFFPNLDHFKLNRPFLVRLCLVIILLLSIIFLLMSTQPLSQIIFALFIFFFTCWASRGFGWLICIILIFLSGFLLGIGAYLYAPLFSHVSPSMFIFLQSLMGLEIVLGLYLAIIPYPKC